MYSGGDNDYILDFIQREENQPRVIRPRPDHFNQWNEKDFIKRFRLSKESARYVIGLIENQIRNPTERNSAVSPDLMVLLTLRFYATGSFLITVGDFAGIHKSTACRIINKISDAIARLRPVFITFPSTPEEILNTKRQFYRVSRFPRCIGALDCTHIKIQSPSSNIAENYRNRKSFFSINVQTICNHDLKIQNIVARWPGSSHDSTIFNNSSIRARLENGEFGDSLLVGDSGYPIRPYLLTPLLTQRTPAEQLYNESQIRTRNAVERSYGVWKRRFPVLALGIRQHLDNVEAIIIATSVLHNIALQRDDEEPPVSKEEEEAINFVSNVPPGIVNINNVNANNNVKIS